MQIFAVMMSCAERDDVRAQTLAELAATDWGEPIHIQMDQTTAGRQQSRQTNTARGALEYAAQYGTEVCLLLEDDLQFNRFLRHNLECWSPLQRGQVTVASLYNPGVGVRRRRPEDNCLEADPDTVYGSQAMILSREAILFLLTHWDEQLGMHDIKISRLAARLGKPLNYHVPSLVQHVGYQSVWGGRFHQAGDYHATWRAAVGSVHPHGFRLEIDTFADCFDPALAGALVQCLRGNRVGDFGCGRGGYVAFLRRHGIICHGLDGNPYTARVPHCYEADLARPLKLSRPFDWVLSLDVGEHIPHRYEHVFLDNLVRNAQEGIIIRWAVPGQGGCGHVNERSNQYVMSRFRERGWFADAGLQRWLRSRSSSSEAPNRLMVFRRA